MRNNFIINILKLEDVKMRNVCLIVGNGIAHDFVNDFKKNLNPSLPLSNFNNDKILEKYRELERRMPFLFENLIQNADGLKNEFELIKNYIEKIKNHEDFLKHYCDLRRFLTISYSYFHIEAISSGNLNTWKWTKWISKHKEKINYVYSLNYDILIENALESCRIYPIRSGTIQFNNIARSINQIPIIKPHGSIDFDVDEFIAPTLQKAILNKNSLAINSIVEQRWSTITTNNDINGRINVIPSSLWLYPRLQADVIPPSQINLQSHLSWVKTGENFIKNNGKSIKICIIAGCSYDKPDQPEIRAIINTFSNNVTFYIVNPQKIPFLIKFIKAKGHKVITLNSEPPILK